MQKRLGKIGTVRREIRGKACPLCGGYRYQLLVHSSTATEEESNMLARCVQCNRPRQLDDGFWKNLVDIKVPDHKQALAKPLELWQTYRKRKEETRKAIQMLAISGAVRPGNVEFRYSTSPDESGILARSFAVAPPSETDSPTPLHLLYGRLQTRVLHAIERLKLQESYVQLQSRCLHLFHWIRRELTARSYFSRI
ncbi:MAG: hypothetical protein NNA31_05925 [Nitrospira sp.]|nr:hypothetical protein [Nitrospira sp.]MCP9462006.1 hypothetical protein [Nitrospira sp.]MCP9469523.1 hypothetical protein [Nitrospira sp.]MCP9475776.1 hypothetical protein [Nitrospira sp.]